jgi:hypothetical protein
MIRFLLKLLPKEYRNLVELGMRIVENLDTKEERQQAVEMGIQILKDGKIDAPEWAKLGKALGIWKKNGKS